MPASLKERALRYMAQREHSRQELARKLAAHAAADEIGPLLDHMEDLGLLSDSRFAHAYVRSHAARFGVQRLRAELARRGVASELADAALEEELEDHGQDELGRAREVWQRKFSSAPADAKEWARQGRFLQSRGFSTAVIRKLLKEPFDESA